MREERIAQVAGAPCPRSERGVGRPRHLRSDHASRRTRHVCRPVGHTRLQPTPNGTFTLLDPTSTSPTL
eukprot:6605096-Prymnesium_polylepis.2